MSGTDLPSGLRGPAAIERALATMPLGPGVYRMLDAKGTLSTSARPGACANG